MIYRNKRQQQRQCGYTPDFKCDKPVFLFPDRLKFHYNIQILFKRIKIDTDLALKWPMNCSRRFRAH